ncbi:hypothetical protein ROHU_030018 [Labeo rohita]|uniref:Uncharacterized protein n=1 Tax=Labeo rohita TaxID=84645 RepID=A0A498LTA0_LABRO|nr:hypothetical protein ROHU_030018 [Labeo rohita]
MSETEIHVFIVMCNARSQKSRNEGNTEHGVETRRDVMLKAPLSADQRASCKVHHKQELHYRSGSPNERPLSKGLHEPEVLHTLHVPIGHMLRRSIRMLAKPVALPCKMLN